MASCTAGALPLPVLVKIIVGFILLFIVLSLLKYASEPRFIAAMRQYKDFAFRKLTEKSISSFRDESTATYLSALTNDASSIEADYLSQQLSLITKAVTFFGALGMMLWYSPVLTSVAIGVTLLPLCASLLAGSRLQTAEKCVSERNKDFTAALADCLSGFTLVKTFKAEKEIFRLFAEKYRALEQEKFSRRKLKVMVGMIGSVAGVVAQLGVFLAFFGAVLLGFTGTEAASIGIIGGADGPTAIYLCTKLAPHLLGPIAIAAYSYMALIPLIQPPLMKLCTTDKMRKVKMEQAREVSKTEKIIFPIVVATFVILLLPSTAPLVGCLMLGNLFRECGVTDRLSDTAQNALMNIITIFLATSVGATMVAQNFLSWNTIKIIVLGLCAFGLSTIGGLLGGVVMYKTSGGRINPLIGSAGVSAVPMAARVSQDEGRKYNKTNFLLMHAMGPNVAGVIGSAIAAGFLLSVFGG